MEACYHRAIAFHAADFSPAARNRTCPIKDIDSTMLILIHSHHDTARAESLRQQLLSSGYTFGDASSDPSVPVIALLSPAALQDTETRAALYRALDTGHHIIPVTTEAFMLPKELDHLTSVNLGEDDGLESLRQHIDAAFQPDAGLPLKVLTPATRRSNSRAGLVIGLLAFGMFMAGIIGIAVFNIEAPIEEYNVIDTQVAQTRDILIAPTLEGYLRFLPGSLAQATEYPATLQAVPTRVRPFVAATATAVAIDQQQ